MASLTGCERVADPRADFAAAAELCVTSLSGEGGSSAPFRDAGWSDGVESAAAGPGEAIVNRRFTKGELTLSLAETSRDRCFVEGPPAQVGSLDEMKATLSRTFGKPTPETRGTFRWKVDQQNMLVKLQQLNTDNGEVLRVYVFRPNPNLIGGVNS